MSELKSSIPQLKLLTILFSLISIGISNINASATLSSADRQYVGSQRCASCHQIEFNNWKKSDHFRSMSSATSNSVLGDFRNKVVQFHGITTTFSEKDGHYFVNTLNEQGKQETFSIKFTFGYKPLQQYLVSTSDGHLQAFNIAWDSRNVEDGGQRWFHLRNNESLTQKSLFFWTKHFQNWNNRCAECHSTNVDRNYDREKLAYKTTWSEINVSCEACHGPASEHVIRAESKKYDKLDSGFGHLFVQKTIWSRKPNESVAQSDSHNISMNQSAMLNTCGGCHSRRTSLGKINPDKNFHDQFRLQTLDEGRYFADGQIREEVFVLGSFMQSKMYKKGVNCGNCHNSHSGEVIIQGNPLCLQCHNADQFDISKHHGHRRDSLGSQCVNCHMPSRTYMGVDERRDHSFTIPRPNLSIDIGVPNACTGCHVDKTNEWANNILSNNALGGLVTTRTEKWAEVNQKLRKSDPRVLLEIDSVISSSDLSPIQIATLMSQFGGLPFSDVTQLIIKGLKDDRPLVRRSAVTALKNAKIEKKINLLMPLLTDPSLSVRNEIAMVLAKELVSFPYELVSRVRDVVDEYKQTLLSNIDSPIDLVGLGNLEFSLGHHSQAENYYLEAINIESGYIPAILNLADYYRVQENEKEAGKWLVNAVSMSKNNASAQHALGLHYIRINQVKSALQHLQLATKGNGVVPRYLYIYALALSDYGNKEESIDLLIEALMDWPNDFGLLNLLISSLNHSGRLEEADKYRIQLQKLVTAANIKL